MYTVSYCYRRAVNNACKMLMALGISKRDVYEDDFEKPFLREAREFFRVSPLIIASFSKLLSVHMYYMPTSCPGSSYGKSARLVKHSAVGSNPT